MTLENYISKINRNIFFREFSFSRNKFSPAQQSELEFSDSVIWLDDLLITFQLKERNLSGEHMIQTEVTWFEKKVLKKATKQIRDTLSYLNTYKEIELTNEKGHVFNVANAQLCKQFNIVTYSPHELLPDEQRDKKFYVSSTAGFIHLIPIYNYLGICQTLITPAEIDEYLGFRENICSKYEVEVNVIPEESLTGQFLYGDLQAKPQEEFVDYLTYLNQNINNFNFSHILHNFEKRIERIVIGDEANNYYRILKELAKLKRTELREFKLRFDLCIEKCKKNEFYVKPYRFSSPRTGCGFVFIVVPPELAQSSWKALQNYTYAHKYDQKLNKCIGVSFFRDGEYFDVGWCYIIEDWKYDKEMERMLKEHFPFRDVTINEVPRYNFQ